MEDNELTSRQYSRLLLARAWHQKKSAYVRDLGVGFLPAITIFTLLYFGIIGKKIALAEWRSWSIVFVGIALWVVFAFLWNLADAGFQVWKKDQQDIDTKEKAIGDVTASKDKAITEVTGAKDADIARLSATVNELNEKMKPRLAVFPLPLTYPNRVSADGSWQYAVLRVSNLGVDQIRNCYAKLTLFWPIQTVSPSGYTPALGTRFPWPDVPVGQPCNIQGHSEEFLSLAMWASMPSNPAQWFLHVQGNPELFPLPAGIWGIAIEVGADNVLPTTFNGRLNWLSPMAFLAEAIQPVLPPAAVSAS